MHKRTVQTDRKSKTRHVKAVAVCGILVALCVVLLYLGSLTVFDLTAVVVCALITMLVVVELGNKYAWLVVCAAGVLSFVLLPSKLIALTYFLIGGMYPILKARFEHFRSSIAWLLKLSCMGSMLLVLIILSKLVFTGEDSYFAMSIPVILIGLLILAVYDMALTGCITFYIVKLRNRLGLKKLF